LQCGKVGHSLGGQHSDFSVDIGRLDRQLGQDRGNVPEPGCPVILVAGQHPDVAALDSGTDPVAVDFDFVKPGVALGRAID
jgi:hypothetical protein